MRFTREYFTEYVANNFKHIFVSVSGGKDSLGTLLYALDHFDHDKIQCVTVDLGYVHPETYAYLIYMLTLADVPLNVVTPSKTFDDYAPLLGAPSHATRWCTVECKLHPISEFLQDKQGAVSLEGTRRCESVARTLRPWFSFEDDSYTSIPTFRPILTMSDMQLATYCTDHNYLFNTIYRNFSRCGCYMCFEAGISEWYTLRKHYPKLFGNVLCFLRKCTENERWRSLYLAQTIKRITAVPTTMRPQSIFASRTSDTTIKNITGINLNTIRDDPTYTFQHAYEDSGKTIDVKHHVPTHSNRWNTLQQNNAPDKR
jgi:3'-phosphoadenosine 5'-phosphosulfate sulfotransferase (PAPS reductase)/FAD synthetase